MSTWPRHLRFSLFLAVSRTALLTTILVATLATAVNAAPITWTGGAGNGSWHSAANWDLVRVPGPGDDVSIPDLPGAASVTYNSGSTSINSISAAEAFSVSGGGLTVGAASSCQTLTINDGTLFLNGTTPITTLYLSGGALDGSGDVTVTTAFTWTGGEIRGGRTFTIPAGLNWGLTNFNGLIKGGATFVNNGTCTLTGSGGLVAFSGCSIRNASGATIEVGSSASLLGEGTLVNEAGGLIRKSGSDISALGRISNAGTIDVLGGTPRFAGQFSANNGAINGGAGSTIELGRTIAVLAGNQELPAGPHPLTWEGRDAGGAAAAAGVYFVRARADDAVRSHKIVLAR